jgi:hypothetical protein
MVTVAGESRNQEAEKKQLKQKLRAFFEGRIFGEGISPGNAISIDNRALTPANPFLLTLPDQD